MAIKKKKREKKNIRGAKLVCIVTGETKYFAPFFLVKKLGKFGSLEEFRKHFMTIPARKLLRQGFTVQQVREQLKVKSDLPEIPPEILSRLKLLKKPGK